MVSSVRIEVLRMRKYEERGLSEERIRELRKLPDRELLEAILHIAGFVPDTKVA